VGGPTQNVYSLDLAGCYLSPNDNLLRQLKIVWTTLNKVGKHCFPSSSFFSSPVHNAVIISAKWGDVCRGRAQYCITESFS